MSAHHIDVPKQRTAEQPKLNVCVIRLVPAICKPLCFRSGLVQILVGFARCRLCRYQQLAFGLVHTYYIMVEREESKGAYTCFFLENVGKFYFEPLDKAFVIPDQLHSRFYFLYSPDQQPIFPPPLLQYIFTYFEPFWPDFEPCDHSTLSIAKSPPMRYGASCAMSFLMYRTLLLERQKRNYGN